MVKCESQHLHIPNVSRPEGQKPETVTPFVIVNFSHHKYLHLPKDHVVAFAEKDCNKGEVIEICTMEELERDIPRNWIPRKNELFKNPLMLKKDDFLKSPVEAQTHRKVPLEDKDISPKTQKTFEKMCERYDKIISKTVATLARPC